MFRGYGIWWGPSIVQRAVLVGCAVLVVVVSCAGDGRNSDSDPLQADAAGASGEGGVGGTSGVVDGGSDAPGEPSEVDGGSDAPSESTGGSAGSAGVGGSGGQPDSEQVVSGRVIESRVSGTSGWPVPGFALEVNGQPLVTD